MEDQTAFQAPPEEPRTPKGVKRRQKSEKARFLEALEQVPIIQVACKNCNISRATYYRWIERDPVFQREVSLRLMRGVDSINDLAESQLIKHLKDGNLHAIKYWLGHRNKEFKDPSHTQHPGGPKTEAEQAEYMQRLMDGLKKTFPRGMEAYSRYLFKKEAGELFPGKKKNGPPTS
jgi:hypothetical protein